MTKRLVLAFVLAPALAAATAAIGLGPISGDTGVLLYLSVEHTLRK